VEVSSEQLFNLIVNLRMTSRLTERGFSIEKLSVCGGKFLIAKVIGMWRRAS
jgi:hypothetical protein